MRGVVSGLIIAGLALWIGGCLPDCESKEPAEATDDEVVRIAALGDIMFGRWRGDGYHAYENEAVLNRIETAVMEADVAAANLETAICRDGRAVNADPSADSPRLTAPPDRVALLAEVGLDVVTVANNHALDCGPNSLARTARHIGSNNLRDAGTRSRPTVRLETATVPLIVYAVTLRAPTRPLPDEAPTPNVVTPDRIDRVTDDLERLRRDHPTDIVIVSLHWGEEGVEAPSDRQRELAADLLTAGADVVHGHGSHTVQPVERRPDGVALYNLGDAHFDNAEPPTRDPAVALLTCDTAAEGRRCRVELERASSD